jgi:hypothetical protein
MWRTAYSRWCYEAAPAPGLTWPPGFFVYDGDGNQVKHVYTATSTLTTYYFAGGSYELRTNGKLEKYYAFAGLTVAKIECNWTADANGNPVAACPAPTNLNYFLTDHLGSVITVLDLNGTPLSQQRYFPFCGWFV